jgi:hypothetical protein
MTCCYMHVVPIIIIGHLQFFTMNRYIFTINVPCNDIFTINVPCYAVKVQKVHHRKVEVPVEVRVPVPRKYI